MKFYCPACGEWTRFPNEEFSLLPTPHRGELQYKCPHCGKRWMIEIKFYEAPVPEQEEVNDVGC